jgi:2-dehydro-3-deoxygalactonokinase
VRAGQVIGDWGNTRLRLWRLESGAVADRREGRGVAQTDHPSAALAAALGNWQADRIVLCGMAGARNGLHETPYVACPADAQSWRSRLTTFERGGASVAIAPGLASSGGGPDVMRGEETQIFGAIASHPPLASGRHLMVLPGTHSKWAVLADGRIESFRTFMTGELFGLLQRSSLFAAGGEAAEADDDGGFSNGLTRSGPLSALLFEARSAQLIMGRSAVWARGFVSGVLIGAELATMKPHGSVTIIGEPELANRYSRALADRGLRPAILDAEQCTIAGLRLLDADA